VNDTLPKKFSNNKKLWRLLAKRLEQQLQTLERYQQFAQAPPNQSQLEPLKALATYSE
jgi:hypothetical protein